ncbi:MAG: hypothetical protein P0S93_06580, partial [Candidatus Neptunochlamydia sp.]|nr:hypothetical protein [Candidatus Neptunochlamydia sp.]
MDYLGFPYNVFSYEVAISINLVPNYTTKHSLISEESICDKIDLSSEDIFHLETLENIQYARFRRGLDFHVVVVKEEGFQFSFEGSRFVEAFLRCRKKLKNPLTKRWIADFTIYRATRMNPKMVPILNKLKTCNPVNYLPVLYNDHTRPDVERGEYYSRLSELLLKEGTLKNKKKALEFDLK